MIFPPDQFFLMLTMADSNELWWAMSMLTKVVHAFLWCINPVSTGMGLMSIYRAPFAEYSLNSDVLFDRTETDPGGLGSATPPTAETAPR